MKARKAAQLVQSGSDFVPWWLKFLRKMIFVSLKTIHWFKFMWKILTTTWRMYKTPKNMFIFFSTRCNESDLVVNVWHFFVDSTRNFWKLQGLFQFFVVLTKQFNIQLNYLNYQSLCIFVILLQKKRKIFLKTGPWEQQAAQNAGCVFRRNTEVYLEWLCGSFFPSFRAC